MQEYSEESDLNPQEIFWDNTKIKAFLFHNFFIFLPLPSLKIICLQNIGSHSKSNAHPGQEKDVSVTVFFSSQKGGRSVLGV